MTVAELPTALEPHIRTDQASPPKLLPRAKHNGGDVSTSDVNAAATPTDRIQDSAANASGEDDDDNARLVWNEPSKPRQISKKKQSEAAGFEAWVVNHKEELTKKKPSAGVEEDDKTVNYLVKDWEGQKIITSPRDYQIELFEKAKTRNTIAVLDTGSGKTLIAALLLRHTIDKELEDRAGGKPRRVAFFVVDKVALVFQQHAVLECNLDCSIDKFCGDMIQTNWTRNLWSKHFADNMIIVITAAVLYDCLHHSYIRMDEINLLVFDEAHHTKKNHPYARIIKDFYSDDAEVKPRIFGMTASPVDAQTDVGLAAAELEGLLHSQISTVSDPTLLQQTVSKPKKEEVWPYARLPAAFDTPLGLRIKTLLGNNPVFRRALEFARECSRELGAWCCDRMWQMYFTEEDLMKLEGKTERNSAHDFSSRAAQSKKVDAIKAAKHMVERFDLGPARNIPEHLSNKVCVLLDALRDNFSTADQDSRCIVFVERRWTAAMLVDLLEQPQIKIPHLRVGTLIGTGNFEDGYTKASFRQQLLTIIKFKKGDLNCIFATSVAEEGLDIPDCNLIIRFDLYRTMIQYIQSRGRARHENSKYIHMIETGNMDHRRRIYQHAREEKVLREFCSALPEDRKLTGNDFDMDYFLRKEKQQRQYTVKSTGAKLTYKQSLVTLMNFVSSLEHGDEVSLTPDYIVQSAPRGFICEVLLPSVSPIRSAIGKVHSSKQVAKCSAAFEMCLELLKRKYIDDDLRPVFAKKVPAMANARLAVSSKKKDEYNMRLKPKLWAELGTPKALYATLLTLSNPDAPGRHCRPLVLLTRSMLPEMAPFPLFFGQNCSSKVHCKPISAVMDVREEDLQMFADFTLKIFHDVFSKEYEASAETLPYFLAPVAGSHGDVSSTIDDVRGLLDWSLLRLVHDMGQIDFADEQDDFFTDKFVADPFDGSRKFFLRGIRKDFKPQDPIPDWQPPSKARDWKTVEHTIRNWTLNVWAKSRERWVWKENQPVVEAELVSLRRNLLDESSSNNDAGPKTCLLVLEPLRISPLPVDVVMMAYNMPAIIYRLESSLIALDACALTELNICPDLALEALTKDSDNTDEPEEEPINFQAGMGKNYERLEFLGDSFLKMATTISIFTLIPDKNEFDYHVERMCLICNQNLFNNALDIQIQEYIRSKAFNRRTWYPQGLVLKKGKKSDETDAHVLGDKTIADVCEALIGAAYMTTRRTEGFDFDMAIQAVTKVTRNKNHPMMSWKDYYAAYNKPEWQTAPSTAAQLELAKKIKDSMGYEFQHPRLLRCAFRHPSYPRSYENLPSYQRLEFLGDALLDMVIVDYLFLTNPTQGPQWLTEHKMAMVSNQFLGCLAVTLGFHKHLMSLNGSLQKQVLEYFTEITQARIDAEDEAEREGRPRSAYARDYWVQVAQPPKCLPDMVEAYVGAMFVDSEYDYGVVQSFFKDHVLPFFRDMRPYDTFASKHPVTLVSSLLGQQFHCNYWGMPSLEVPVEEGEGVLTGRTNWAVAFMVHGKHVVGTGISESTRYAKVYAAKNALRVLEKMSLAGFREKYGCDCTVDEESEALEMTDVATAI